MAITGEAHFFADTKQVQAALHGLAVATEPVAYQAWLLTAMYPYLVKRIRARFASEGDDAVGGQWAPLSDATQDIRHSKGFSPAHPINVRTGALYNFVTTSSGTTVDPLTASISIPGDGGSSELIKKLTVSMLGYDDPATPPRPVLGMDAGDAVWATAALGVWIMTAAAAAAGRTNTRVVDVS